MSEVAPPSGPSPRRRPSRTLVLLSALVVLAGVVDVVRGDGDPDGAGAAAGRSDGQPLVVQGCGRTTGEPSPGDPGAVTARLLVTYRPTGPLGTDGTAEVGATEIGATEIGTAGDGTAEDGAVQPVRVAGVVESVGDGLALLVQPCQAVAATLYGALPDGSVVEAAVEPGRLSVSSLSGGRIDLVDSAGGARRIHGGRTGFTGFGGWYAVMSDPAPGSYPWRSAVTWRRGAEVVGRGEVDLRLELGAPPG